MLLMKALDYFARRLSQGEADCMMALKPREEGFMKLIHSAVIDSNDDDHRLNFARLIVREQEMPHAILITKKVHGQLCSRSC